MAASETFQWRPRTRSGVLSAPVTVRLEPEDADELRDLAVALRASEPGPGRTRLLNEITTRMDLHALLDARRIR